MSDGSIKPIIFISYSHKDEPEKPADGEIQWLSFVRVKLQPAVKNGVFDLWVDREMMVGDDWQPEIEAKLRACDIFILLVSDNSMSSDYIVDKEIPIIRERQAKGDGVHFCPLLLTPTTEEGLNTVKDKNLRPLNLRPFSNFSFNDRLQQMKEAADEIAIIAKQITARKTLLTQRPITEHIIEGILLSDRPARPTGSAYVHTSGLPETAYERLVGRDAELKRLDDAWADPNINILSLIAEGGAGKSALVNEWLTRMQADNSRGAKAVLGWSFYSQGTKERATSADSFLDWALERLGVKLATTSAVAKGEAIAEATMRRRVLLVLDGVEPLQHGPDGQTGQLKDPGLRALLRRFAATPPDDAHGLIVLTSRLAVADIFRWKDGAAPVVDVEKLSDDAGAALLRDNGVWGTTKQLEYAARDFGGHPLALGLLASYLTETQTGDVRRRDHFRPFRAGSRHDQAWRVMESYEKEWLAGQPVLLAIMQTVGLFDRPASGNCLKALRTEPVIAGLTDPIVGLGEEDWGHAVARLREVRLLAPPDKTSPDALDTHPLVREWFGERLRRLNEEAWKAAHGRIYEHLRNTTKEGDEPTLADLAPLYQAIAHGCRAGRHQEALEDIYVARICRYLPNGSVEFHSLRKLGSFGDDLAAISWFFAVPYEVPSNLLNEQDQSWALAHAASCLGAQGRFGDALPTMRKALRIRESKNDWSNAANAASNLSRFELIAGEVAAASITAEKSISSNRASLAAALHAAGDTERAKALFGEAELHHSRDQPDFPILYGVRGYDYCDLLITRREYVSARDRAIRTLTWVSPRKLLLDIALDTLTIGRANFAISTKRGARRHLATNSHDSVRKVGTSLREAVEGLRASGKSDYAPYGHIARAAFRRNVGDWDGAAHDLDEVEEIAEPGPMRLFLCDAALERARLAFARVEAFAPLNGLVDNSPPKPALPGTEETARLKQDAKAHLDKARKLIADCGYHRRDEELAELDAVLAEKRRFADLPPRV